jgi:hypothetical protein
LCEVIVQLDQNGQPLVKPELPSAKLSDCTAELADVIYVELREGVDPDTEVPVSATGTDFASQLKMLASHKNLHANQADNALGADLDSANGVAVYLHAVGVGICKLGWPPVALETAPGERLEVCGFHFSLSERTDQATPETPRQLKSRLEGDL